MMTVLKDMVENDNCQEDDSKFAMKLRHVADELTRAAQQLEDPHQDEIKFFHEDNGQVTSNHNESTKVNAFQQIANLKNNFKENNSANNVKLINRAMRELGETEGDVRR